MPSGHAHPSGRGAFPRGRVPPPVRRLPRTSLGCSSSQTLVSAVEFYPKRGLFASVMTEALAATRVQNAGMKAVWRTIPAKGNRASPAATRVWFRRCKTRRRLRELGARELDDIGLTESQRRRECTKWFWQIGGEVGVIAKTKPR